MCILYYLFYYCILILCRCFHSIHDIFHERAWLKNDVYATQVNIQLQGRIQNILTRVMLNKLRCHVYFQFSANQTTWSRLLVLIQILNDKQCRSREISQLIWIYTVCKGRAYPGSARQGLTGGFKISDGRGLCRFDQITILTYSMYSDRQASDAWSGSILFATHSAI